MKVQKQVTVLGIVWSAILWRLAQKNICFMLKIFLGTILFWFLVFFTWVSGCLERIRSEPELVGSEKFYWNRRKRQKCIYPFCWTPGTMSLSLYPQFPLTPELYCFLGKIVSRAWHLLGRSLWFLSLMAANILRFLKYAIFRSGKITRVMNTQLVFYC